MGGEIFANNMTDEGLISKYTNSSYKLNNKKKFKNGQKT